MNPGVPRRRRARPVADAPVDELLAQSDELAKGWLLALLEHVALQDAASVLAGGLAADGPRICAAALRAIADDRDLRRLEPGGVLEPLVSACGAFAGDGGPAAALRAVDALHAVLWSALRSELRDPEPELISDVAVRLDAVCELIRTAAVTRAVTGAPLAAVGGPSVDRPPVGGARAGEPGAAGPATPGSGLRAAPASAVVPPEPEGWRPDPLEWEDEERTPGASPGSAEPDAWSAPAPVFEAPPGSRRDDALWVAALDDEVARSHQTGGSLSLLLAELEDGERIAVAGSPAEAGAAFGRFAQAVRGVLRRQDLLASEDQLRVWVIARDTGRPGARALADRIATAVAELEPMHGAPLAVSVGLAVLGEDAHDCASLLDAAEEAALMAASRGERVAEHVPGSGPGEVD